MPKIRRKPTEEERKLIKEHFDFHGEKVKNIRRIEDRDGFALFLCTLKDGSVVAMCKAYDSHGESYMAEVDDFASKEDADEYAEWYEGDREESDCCDPEEPDDPSVFPVDYIV